MVIAGVSSTIREVQNLRVLHFEKVRQFLYFELLKQGIIVCIGCSQIYNSDNFSDFELVFCHSIPYHYHY